MEGKLQSAASEPPATGCLSTNISGRKVLEQGVPNGFHAAVRSPHHFAKRTDEELLGVQGALPSPSCITIKLGQGVLLNRSAATFERIFTPWQLISNSNRGRSYTMTRPRPGRRRRRFQTRGMAGLLKRTDDPSSSSLRFWSFLLISLKHVGQGVFRCG
jgi:hypothetical protein